MYKLDVNLLPKGHRLRPGGDYKKMTVTIHSTGNLSSSPRGERNWLNNSTNKRLAAWHYVVGEGLVIQAIPENETAWHCGNATGNNHSIGIEIVESGDRCKVLTTAAEFVADLLKKYGWGIDKLKRHYDWTGKICPRILIDPAHIKGSMDWNWFLKTVEAILEGGEELKPEQAYIKVNGKIYQMERIFVNDTNYIKIRDLEKAGFKVSNEKDMAVLDFSG